MGTHIPKQMRPWVRQKWGGGGLIPGPQVAGRRPSGTRVPNLHHRRSAGDPWFHPRAGGLPPRCQCRPAHPSQRGPSSTMGRPPCSSTSSSASSSSSSCPPPAAPSSSSSAPVAAPAGHLPGWGTCPAAGQAAWPSGGLGLLPGSWPAAGLPGCSLRLGGSRVPGRRAATAGGSGRGMGLGLPSGLLGLSTRSAGSARGGSVSRHGASDLSEMICFRRSGYVPILYSCIPGACKLVCYRCRSSFPLGRYGQTRS